jgi:predicted nucleic acid-binding protein
MAVAELLVDTDILVDHLRRARRFEPGEDRVSYSVITRCELFAASSADEEIIGALLGTMSEIDIGRAIAERGGRIRRDTGIPTRDALIAATALEHGLSIFTRNARHFTRVPGLELH